MEFVVVGVNILFKMGDIIKVNGKIVKCMEMEDYIINLKKSHMMDLGIEVNFLGKGFFIISILLILRSLLTTIIYF